jgi:peptidyl-prolyl cis-trans isomerase B (cyclophilin B)
VEGSEDRTKWIALAVFALIAVVVVAAILIGRSGGGDDSSSAASATGGCKQVEAPKPKKVSFAAPKQVVTKGEKLTAIVETSCGTFHIALDSTRAPKTVNSFVFLSKEGFYDGIAFHRIIPGFVVQVGDPLGTGSGGPGYSVDEKPPANLAYTKGIVAMAKSPAEPPGRSGSQLFVVLGPDAALEPEYALVGKVDKGFEIVEQIGKLGTKSGTPNQVVLIEKITIDKG